PSPATMPSVTAPRQTLAQPSKSTSRKSSLGALFGLGSSSSSSSSPSPSQVLSSPCPSVTVVTTPWPPAFQATSSSISCSSSPASELT
ncbi:hypothetical protein BGZ73_002095, partial [Actinomortierella ambigua]